MTSVSNWLSRWHFLKHLVTALRERCSQKWSHCVPEHITCFHLMKNAEWAFTAQVSGVHGDSKHRLSPSEINIASLLSFCLLLPNKPVPLFCRGRGILNLLFVQQQWTYDHIHTQSQARSQKHDAQRLRCARALPTWPSFSPSHRGEQKLPKNIHCCTRSQSGIRRCQGTVPSATSFSLERRTSVLWNGNM